MKQFIKSNVVIIVLFMIIGVILGGIVVYAATADSRDVYYDKSTSAAYGATKDDVQGAITELYQKADECINKPGGDCEEEIVLLLASGHLIANKVLGKNFKPSDTKTVETDFLPLYEKDSNGKAKILSSLEFKLGSTVKSCEDCDYSSTGYRIDFYDKNKNLIVEGSKANFKDVEKPRPWGSSGDSYTQTVTVNLVLSERMTDYNNYYTAADLGATRYIKVRLSCGIRGNREATATVSTHYVVAP